MTKEDWKEVEERWESLFDSIEFKVDGFDLCLQPEMHKMRLVHTVYINDWLKGMWLDPKHEECRRFYRVKESFVWSKKYRDEMQKIYGKREYNKRKDDFEKKLKSYYPWWTSFSSFKRHLTANNKDIRLISKQARGSEPEAKN